MTEQGVYEVRAGGSTTGRPQAIAVNIDPVEADLTPLDPAELVAAVTGHATQEAAEADAAPEALSPEDSEKRQALWWYLLMAGMLLLAAETVISNRLSRKEKFL